MSLNIFDTKNCKYIREETVKFLKEEQEDGVIEITLETENFVDAKIAARKRLYFYLHYGAFMFKGKTFSLSHFGDNISIKIGEAHLDITDLELNGFLDNVSISVDY